MRDITAQLDSYQDHLDELYPAVTVDEIYDVDLERVDTPLRPRSPGLRNSLAFAAAFVVALVIIGVGALFVAGDETPGGDEPAGETTVPVTSTPETTTPPTTQAPVAATTVVPATPPGLPLLMDWSRVALGEAVADGVFATVIPGGPGLIAGGFTNIGGERSAAVWTSPDGRNWEQIRHDDAMFGGERAHEITDIAAGDTGYVAIGSDGREGMVWTSTDGYGWERVPPSTTFAGDGYIKMNAVTYGPAGYVAVGYESEPGNEAMIDHGVVWVSPDGTTWERIDSDLLVDSLMMDDVATSGSGYIAVGLDWTPAPIHPGVWVSPDGREWSQIDVADGNGGAYMMAVAVADDFIVASGIYAPGLAIPEDEGDGYVTMWLSNDAATWTRVPNHPGLLSPLEGAYPYAVAISGERIVVVGESKPTSVVTSQGGVWVSNDARSDWHHIAAPAETFGVDAGSTIIMRDVIEFGGAFVAVGVYDNEAAVWTGVWTEESG